MKTKTQSGKRIPAEIKELVRDLHGNTYVEKMDVVSLCEYVSKKYHLELTLAQGNILLEKIKFSSPSRARKRILEVKIIRALDVDRDTSYLGEYSQRQSSRFSIDRAHSQDCASLAANSGPALSQLRRILKTPAGEPRPGESEANVVKYTLQDYERMESLNNGNWSYIGIRAEAEIVLPYQVNKGCVRGHEVYAYLTQTLGSGGLWGIESDSERSYFEEVKGEELSQLKGSLRTLGFSARAIATAFKSVEEVEE